jgi:uncharacterized protein YuzE
MQMTGDPQADALSIRFSAAAIEQSDAVEAGIILDADVDGRRVAIAILDLRKRVALPCP